MEGGGGGRGFQVCVLSSMGEEGGCGGVQEEDKQIDGNQYY